MNWISKPLFWGWQNQLPNAYNRLTALINFCAIMGSITVLFVGINIYSYGSWLAFWYIVPASLGMLCLWLNFHYCITSARLVMVLNTNLIALFAGLFFGKGFNGYLTFFLALFFSVSLFGKEKRQYMITCLVISFLGLPLLDILSSLEWIPLVRIPALNQNKLPALLIDSIVISGIFVFGLAADRWHSESYEKDLERWNAELDKEVKGRLIELLNAKESAEHASLLKTQFLANISHELRTPMQAISGFTQLAKAKLHSEEDSKEILEKYLSEIEKAALRLKNFLSPLFEITTSGPPSLSFHPSKGSLKTIIERTLSLYEKVKTKKNISTLVTFEENAYESAEIETDFALLESSLNAVINNAFKFANPNTQIEIHISYTNRNYTIDVTNTGPGIPERDKDIVFEAFTQSSITNKNVGGTGLGLYRARRYMHTLRGDLTLVSNLPEKTTFRLRFPV